MSYLVLARKWRPRVFDDVVGQEHVTRTLQNAIRQDRVAHALLFTGSRGVGKTSCARILAKALNCERGPTVDPCGVCAACLDITSGGSTDVLEIDGASNNGVEQVREIRESVKFLPARGKRKMYIIDEVHMLTTAAFNALLKTLEEPPAHVVFVFATTEPHKIPETILSRCQRFDFKRIPEKKIVDAIGRIAAAEGVEVAPEALHHIAREAEGGMRDSLSLLDQVIAFCGTRIDEAQVREVLGIADRGLLTSLTQAVLEGDGQRALLVVEELFHFGLDLQKFAAEFVQHLRDLMVVKLCRDPARLVDLPESEVEQLAALVVDQPPARLHRLFSVMMQGAEEVSRSSFPRLALEMSLLRLCEQGATLPLAEVLKGLSRLEARLDGGESPPPSSSGGPTPGSGAPRGPTPSASPPPPPMTGPRAYAPTPMTSMTGGAAGGHHATSALAEARALDPEPMPPARIEAPAPPVLEPARCVDPEAEPNGRGCVGGAYTSVPPPATHYDDEGLAVDAQAERPSLVLLTDGRPATDHFADYVEAVRNADSFLAADLEQSVRLMRLDRERLTLAVPTSAWDDLFRHEARLQAVAEATFQGVERGFEVELRRYADGDENVAGETLHDRRTRLASERLSARKAAAVQDPGVLTAMSVLGVQIHRVLPR
jgi:DNA polymerase-3 subunit gamma/tau